MDLSSQDTTYDEISSILRIPTRFRQEKHVLLLMHYTRNVQFFKKITEEQGSSEIHKDCCQIMSMEEYSESDIIINFGEMGEKFYIILKGSVSVLVPVKKKIKVSRNEINHYKNIKEVTESSSSSSSEYENFEEMHAHDRKERREGIAVVSVSEIVKSLQHEKKVFSKNKEENHGGVNELSIAKLFVDKFKKEKKDIVRVVKEANDGFIEIEVDKLDEVTYLKQGDSFGELALLSDRPRAATVIARERTSLLVIKQYQFKRILGAISEKRVNSKIKFLRSLPYFRSWTKSALLKISLYFTCLNLQRNQFLFYENQEVKEIFFIKEGEFLVTKKIQTEESVSPKSFQSSNVKNRNRKVIIKNKLVKLCIKGKNESIGGYEVLNKLQNRNFSCTCESTTAEVYCLQKEHFFSRIPHVEYIKSIINEENSRLLERFEEVSEVEKAKEISEKTISHTPQPGKKKFSFKNTNFISEFNLTLSRRATPSPCKDKNFSRMLTPIEIDRAINGKLLKTSFKKDKKHSFIKRRSPPPSFMHKSRDTLRIYNNL